MTSSKSIACCPAEATLTMRAGALLAQQPQQQPRQQEACQIVDGEAQLVSVRAHLPPRPGAAAPDAGVVDQQIEAVDLVRHARREAPHFGKRGEVGGDEFGFAARLAGYRARRLRRVPGRGRAPERAGPPRRAARQRRLPTPSVEPVTSAVIASDDPIPARSLISAVSTRGFIAPCAAAAARRSAPARPWPRATRSRRARCCA